MSSSSHFSFNYVSDILDEIALEGLDGITVEALWMRLSFRPKFMFTVDNYSKNFLWNIIIHLKDLQFYELPQERPSLKYYDYSVTDESISNEIRLELDEVYPYCSVKGETGIFGSCQQYHTRVNVTYEATQLTVEEVEAKWGNKLVIVASQDCRYTALLGNEGSSNIDFSSSPIMYEILERIGRCRQVGSLNCGKGSLQVLVGDVKSIFHYLKYLTNQNLIKKQSLLGSLSLNLHASLVYLSRFFEENTNETVYILRTVIEEMKSRPPHFMMPCDELYSLFDESKKQRVKKYKSSVMFRKYITVTPCVPYREIYPNAPPTEWEKKTKGEKTVRCFKLINPEVDLNDISMKDCDSDEEDGISGFLPRGIFYKGMPIVFQAYHHIKNAGGRGLTHRELGQIMGLNKYFIRALIKRLSTDKLCEFFFENEGRRRSKRYIVGENAQTKAAASEIAQIISGTPIKTEPTKEDEQNKPETTPNDEVKKPEMINISKLEEKNISYRGLKRIGLIIKTIKANRFRLFHQIYKVVAEEEKKEGLTTTVDRQTIVKLLKKLEEEGLIKMFILTGKDGSDTSVKIFADPTFDPGLLTINREPMVALTRYPDNWTQNLWKNDKAKENIYNSNFTSASTPENKDKWPDSIKNEFSNSLLENIAVMQQMLKGVAKTVDKIVAKENDLSCLYLPKYIRLNVLHEFLFHLVYDYTGIISRSQKELIDELEKTTVLEDLKKEMPTLYNTEPSSYMFVPPLNTSGKNLGWLFISDLLIRMPLSVIVKVIRATESSPEVWKYLNHPVRKHYLVKDLPPSVRKVFFGRKNQIANFHYDIRRLCYLGLIQFGPKFGKEHYLTMIYLNRKASLLDTTKSPPGYLRLPSNVEFPVKSYEFQTKNDVKKYWVDMFNICMATKLGEKEFMIGDEAMHERELSKESLKKYYEPKSLEQAIEDDNGELPGDHSGAGGIDSCMFSFLTANWSGPVTKKSGKQPESGKVKKVTKVPLQKLKTEKQFGSIKTRRKVISVNINRVKELPGAKKKSKKKIKKIQDEEAKRLRKSGYDDADLEALKLMETMRVTWSTAEDNLLLLCRVAAMFLSPKPKSFAKIPWFEIRLALRQHVPESRNKTQKAIARRTVYMMRNPTTARSVNLCLESLKQMPESRAFDCTELVELIKPTTPKVEQHQRVLYEKFHELVAFLKDRFIDNPNAYPTRESDLIPDSLEEFLEKFEMEKETEQVLDVKAIRENVIRGILMSSFCCRSDKTSAAVQLFDIYRQYNDDELQNATQTLHSDRVITINKKANSALLKSGNLLPLTFSPYKLSFAFQHMLNTKYAHCLYPEAYAQITKLLQLPDEKEIELDFSECNVAFFLLASLDIVSFIAVLPEQIILLDKCDLSDATYSKMVAKYCKMLQNSQLNSKVVCTSEIDTSKTDDDEDCSEMKKRRMSNSKEDSSEGESSLDLSTEKKTRSSRVILYMMREEAQKDSKQEFIGRSMVEFCTVNATEIFIKWKKNELMKLADKMNPKLSSSIIKKANSRVVYPINLVDEDEIISKMENITETKKVLEFICSKKELGATVKDLKENCKSENLKEILLNLLDGKIILKSGINETRYVSQKYSTPWLLNSFKMKRLEREKLKPNEAMAVSLGTSASDDEVPKKKMKGVVELKGEDYNPPACSTNASNKLKVIIRPWIRIDGSMNRKVLDRFLSTILGFILSRPGSKLQDIMNKFVPWITPVWTKDLVEILYEIGCITMKTLVVVQKPTLFTNFQILILDKYTGLEEDDCVIVEGKMDAINTLGLFIGKKTYSKDFLYD